MRLLDPSLVPTRLVEATEWRTIDWAPVEPPIAFWRFRMCLRLAGFLSRIGWLFVLGRLTDEELAKRLRAYFEEMGGLMIKVGQLLSLRRDLFPKVLTDELSRLLDQTKGFPPEVARQVLEDELGGPVEEFFDEFVEKPFAAASVGQIHRAHLPKEGIWVAVKILRPNVRRTFKQQLGFTRMIARVIEWTPLLPHLRPKEIIAELEYIMMEELDYRIEASNIRRMRRNLRAHGIYAPRVFSRLSSERVLTMEYIQGALMSDYIRVFRSDPERIRAWCRENDIEPSVAGKRLYRSLLRQIFEDNLFHGDLHPGNIILLRNSKIAFIDFGTIGSMERDYQRKYLLFLHSVAEKDYSKSVDVVLMLGSTLPVIDIQEMKEECIRILRAWETRTMTRGLPYHQKSVANMYQSLLMVMHRYEVPSTWLFLKIDRASLTLDATLQHLIPDANFPKLLRQYFRQSGRRNMAKAAKDQLGGQAISGALSLVDLVPEMVYDLRMFMSPMIRKRAVSFQGSLTKVDKLFAVFFGQISMLALAVCVYFLLVFLQQHHPWLVEPLAGRWLVESSERFPKLDYTIWLVVLVVAFNFFYKLRGLKKSFAARGVRLPEP